MRTTIDAGGRIVVPKHLRERVGLTAGAQVEIDEADGVITVTAHRPQVRLEDRGGVLVAVTEAADPTVVNAQTTRLVLEAVRDRRT